MKVTDRKVIHEGRFVRIVEKRVVNSHTAVMVLGR
jgi:hypothetical protein